MGGAVQSSLKGWVPLRTGSVLGNMSDSGVYIHRLLTSGANFTGEEILNLCGQKTFCLNEIVSDRFLEDLCVFVELLNILRSTATADCHEVLALVHKINSPEKLMKSLFALATLKPFDMDAMNQTSQAKLCDFIEVIMAARCYVLEAMIVVIEAVQEAAGENGSFPRWSHAASFLARCKFALFALGLVKYINSVKTASDTSLFAEFLIQATLDDHLPLAFEDLLTLLIVEFGFWLGGKRLNELALMWLDSFDLNVLSSTAPVREDLRAVLSYLRGILSIALERRDGADLLLEVSLLFPLACTNGYLGRFVCRGESWNRLVFLKHCIDLAAAHGHTGAVRELCESALLCTGACEPSLGGLDISGASSSLQIGLEIALTHFQVLLDLEEIEQAFTAIDSVPQLFDKPKECFRLLVASLLADKSLRHYFIELPWAGLWPELLSILEGRRELHLLFSLHSFRSDHKQAAMALYLSALCESNQEEARMLLILAKQTLLLCAEQDAWFIHEHRIVTPADLETEIVSAEAKQFVLEREFRCDYDDYDTLFSTLFKYGAYRIALQLSRCLGNDLDPIFYELAQEYIFYKKSPSQADPEALQWVDLWLEECEYILLDPAAAIGKVIREQLTKEKSLQLFAIVCEALLQSGLALPDWLLEDLGQFDVSLLIRSLLKAGKAEDAYKIAVDALTMAASLIIEDCSRPGLITDHTLESLRSALHPPQQAHLDQAMRSLLDTVTRLSA